MRLYEPLGERHVRLLRIDSFVHTEPRSQICCRLEVYELANRATPSFTALSYTWGPPHPDTSTLCNAPWSEEKRILCNGEEVEVKENLYNFLHEYGKQHSASFQHDCLWIDALCINQSDTIEKNSQVRLMAQIYRAASRVIVWLGPGDSSGDLSLDLIAGLVAISDREKRQLHPRDVRVDHPNYLLNLDHWLSLIHLFQRTWFDRVWVIQEVVLARLSIVWCGSRFISFDEVGIVSDFLATSIWLNFMKDPRLTPNQSGLKCWLNTPTRLIASRDKLASGDHDGFLFALVRARKSSSYDPRDKVYSQLGLGNAELHPTYTMSVAEVYIDAARYIVQQSENLLILGYVESRQSIPELPSWVPDWGCTDGVGLGITGYPQFHADADQQPIYALFKDGLKHVLRVRARRFDNIIMTCKSKRELQGKLSTSGVWNLTEALGESYKIIPEQPSNQALWRTLTTNRESISTTERIQYPASPDRLEPSFRAWILWRYALEIEEPFTFPRPSPTSIAVPTGAEIKDARIRCASDADYLMQLEHEASLFNFTFSLAMDLRPFLTQTGFLGIGAQSLQPNDSLWIVPGCRVPLIFRTIKGSTHYRLVGGAYVHGIMDGQMAFDNAKTNYTDIDLE